MADDSAARSDIPVPDPTASSTAAERTPGGSDVGVAVGHGSAPQSSQARGSRVGRAAVAGARRADVTTTRPHHEASYGNSGAERQPNPFQRQCEVPAGGLRHQRAHEHPGRTGTVPGTRQDHTAAGRAFVGGSSRVANSGRGHAACGRGFASAKSRLAGSGRGSATAGINQASAFQQGSGTASGGRDQLPAHHSSSMAHNMNFTALGNSVDARLGRDPVRTDAAARGGLAGSRRSAFSVRTGTEPGLMSSLPAGTGAAATSSTGLEMPLGFDFEIPSSDDQRRGSAVFEVAGMDAPEPGGMQDVLNPVSTEYDSNNLMINGDDDEVDDDGDDDDDKDYDYKAEMGPAHQGPQGTAVHGANKAATKERVPGAKEKRQAVKGVLAKKPRATGTQAEAAKPSKRTVMVMDEALPAFKSGLLVCPGHPDAIKEVRKLPQYLEKFWERIGGYLFPIFPGYQYYSRKFEHNLVCSITRSGLLANGVAPLFKINNLDDPLRFAEGETPRVAFEHYCAITGNTGTYNKDIAYVVFGFKRTLEATDVRETVRCLLYNVCTPDEKAYMDRNMLPGEVPEQANPVNSIGKT